MRRMVLVLLLLGSWSSGAVSTALSAQAAGALPDVVSMTVPSDPVDLEASPEGAHFTLHLTDDVGILGGESTGSEEPLDARTYLLVNDPGKAGGYVVRGTLTSGTATDGVWDFGGFGIFKPYGDWTINKIHLVSSDGDVRNVVPAARGFADTFSTIGRFGAFTTMSPFSGAPPTLVPWGRTLTVSGRLAWWYNASPTAVPGVTVKIHEVVEQTPLFDGSEPVIGTTTTRPDGSWTFTYTPKHNAFRIYATWAKGTTPSGIRFMEGLGWTGRVNSQVKVGIASFPRSLPAGSVGAVEGNVQPLKVGQPAYLQRYTNQGWRTVSRATIRSSGRFTLPIQPPGRTTYKYRVYKAGDAYNVGQTTLAFSVVGT